MAEVFLILVGLSNLGKVTCTVCISGGNNMRFKGQLPGDINVKRREQYGVETTYCMYVSSHVYWGILGYTGLID